MPDAFANHQNEVYLRGMVGEVPGLPVDPFELERAAHAAMTPQALGYVAGGAGVEETMRANREAFARHRIVPRMLRGVGSERDLSVAVCGTRLNAPVMLGPVGVLEIVHPEAERAVAQACAATGVGMVLSTAASSTMEDVAAELRGHSAGDPGGAAPGWFQLYWPSDRELAASFLRRAEAAGYGALVVTLDTWQLGWRPRDLRGAYLPFLQLKGMANYLSDPVFRSRLAKPPEDDPQAAVMQWLSVFSDPTLTWDDLAFLREHTSLPVVLKGIQSADDARRAVDSGVEGVIVSNHGGRQVDGAVASLDQLPAVRDAVGDRLSVLFDSGVRTGADAIKALALGAEAVLLGRTYVHGLALGGAAGVEHALKCFLADLDLSLGLSGHARPGDLGPESLAPASGATAPRHVTVLSTTGVPA
jgi:lactate 2-monooxygenase